MLRAPAPAPAPVPAFATLAGVVTLALLAACDDPFALPRASIPNAVDTVRLSALEGTPLHEPSAFHLERGAAVRTDQTIAFDFAFNFDAAGEPVFLPPGALDLGRSSGLQLVTAEFDSVTLALERGYNDTSAVAVPADVVVLVRSRPVNCFFGALHPLYAKVHVLTVDPVVRTIEFEVLVNANCGYRGLEPGLPQR